MAEGKPLAALRPPRHKLEDVVAMEDDLEAARAAMDVSRYARERDKQAIGVRDERIRRAKEGKTPMTVIARETGLSLAMVRVICRG